MVALPVVEGGSEWGDLIESKWSRCIWVDLRWFMAQFQAVRFGIYHLYRAHTSAHERIHVIDAIMLCAAEKIKLCQSFRLRRLSLCRNGAHHIARKLWKETHKQSKGRQSYYRSLKSHKSAWSIFICVCVRVFCWTYWNKLRKFVESVAWCAIPLLLLLLLLMLLSMPLPMTPPINIKHRQSLHTHTQTWMRKMIVLEIRVCRAPPSACIYLAHSLPVSLRLYNEIEIDDAVFFVYLPNSKCACCIRHTFCTYHLHVTLAPGHAPCATYLFLCPSISICVCVFCAIKLQFG